LKGAVAEGGLGRKPASRGWVTPNLPDQGVIGAWVTVRSGR
jgi:hypothetical protein